MGKTPARQRDSYVLIIGLDECFLHKRNIAGSVPYAGTCGFQGIFEVFQGELLLAGKQSAEPLLLGQQ
jgi:electron transfer flavoprotein alpha/beta subunit